ncbi:MAG: carboxylate--amine ligase [Dorea sp.]|nr:carboxylate--amine ligase [Dorea sp.]
MKKILISGAGGAPTENVVRSWKESGKEEYVVGIGSEPFDMVLSSVDIKYQVPYSTELNYKGRLLEILDKERPDFAHFQNDIEIRTISRMREELLNRNIKLFMPSKETIEICVDKSRSAEIWLAENIRIPKTMVIFDEKDLKKAFEKLGDDKGNIWIRATVGGGGKGALPTNNYEFAKLWIDRFDGWGNFTAAECLTPQTVTWLSIWYEGEIVVAQTRKRNSWNFGNRTLSGVTGITRVGETCSDELIDRIAIDSIKAIDKRPHGIFGVDMTYDKKGVPNPTEINISRFFTTVYFFTKAGLNLPEIFKNIALYGEFPHLKKKINPLPNGLIWIRGMDREPVLTTEEKIEQELNLM